MENETLPVTGIASTEASQPGRQSSPCERGPRGHGLRELRNNWRKAGLLAALAIIAAIPYLNSLSNGFVYDDDFQVLDNPYLRSFHYLHQIFTTSAWSFTGGAGGNTNYYRPMMTFGYLLCYQLFGPNAFAFHLVSLILHVGVVLLVYGLTKRLFQDWRLGLLAALVFALHPVHSESVDWVGAVTDIELTLFYLAAFWFYLRLPQLNSTRAGWRWARTQMAVLACLALALLSKEQAITLPVLAILYEHFYREDRAETSIGEKIARYVPCWLLVPIYLLLRARCLGGFAAVAATRTGIFLEEQVLSAVALIGQYVEKMLWPARLCLYYVFSTRWTILLPAVLGGITALVLGALLFAVLWRKARLVSFGLVWFVLTLAPVLNVNWMPAAAFAERYLYLPSVGLCWVIAWAALRLWDAAGGEHSGPRPAWRVAFGSAALALAALATARIVTRNRDWKNDVTLFRRTLEVSPDSYVIHTDLGKVYWDEGQHKLAEQEWNAASNLDPDSVSVLDDLGLALSSEHRYDEALADLERAAQLSPDDTMAHVDLGSVYEDLGRRRDAAREFERAVSLSPLSVLARSKLGERYLEDGRTAEAEAQFRASLAVAPSLSAWLGLGLARWRQGDAGEAEHDFKSAEAADPKEGRVHFVLATLYSSTGRKPEALSEYQAGLKIAPANPPSLEAYQKLESETSSAKLKSSAAPSSPGSSRETH